MNGALAIFVKTPGLSPVKTRLAEALTTPAAEQFYRLAVQATTEVVQNIVQSTAITPYYAVAEQQAMPLWSTFPVIWQGKGGLGAKMDCIYRQLLAQHDFVILIGSDIPQMTQNHLQQAIVALQTHELVVAPSQDGGFWLFGGRSSLPAHVWTKVDYSQADTAQQFLCNLADYGEVLLQEPLQDVDEVSDLKPLLHSLAALPQPTAAQRQLLTFLQPYSFYYA
jgi:rSAM/selenodomain-associated transferase 1